MISPGVFAAQTARRARWHPVAFAADVAGQPVHALRRRRPAPRPVMGDISRYQAQRCGR
jgi:hypothetical protein